MDERLDSLVKLVPDLGGRVSSLHPRIVAALVTALPLLPGRLIHMRQLFPAANISAMAATRPQLLLQPADELAAAAQRLRQLLGRRDVDHVVEQEPLFLEVDCVDEVLLELRRLMPAGVDVTALLVRDPSWLLRVQRGQKWLGQHPDSDPGELAP